MSGSDPEPRPRKEDVTPAMPHSIGPGTLLGGRYRLDDLLSEHGTSRFFRGTDTVLARSVAINVVPSGDPRADRLLDAARRSATVLDPRLLRVLDCDDAGTLAWVVNEWGSGLSLDILLERGSLPASRAAWLTLEVAQTIQAAHDAGVCHGRLSPESVLVTHAGAVKLIGFAVSASIAAPSTMSAYGSLDERERDVIDLAGILYAGLTGTWPGVSPSAVKRAPMDTHGPLRPRQVRAGVPRMLDVICQRVLRREAHDHVHAIETAHEVAAALHDFVGENALSPLDVASMYVEPTVSLHPGDLAHLTPTPPMPSQPVNRARPATPPAAAPAPPTPPTPAAPPAAPPKAKGTASRRTASPVADDGGEPTAAVPRVESTSASSSSFFDELEKPLFADSHRRTPDRVSPAAVPPVATPTGPRPPVADEPAVDDGEQNWLRWAAWLAGVVAVVVAMVIAFNLGSGDSAPQGATTTTQQPTSTAGQTLKVQQIFDFDPEGNPPSENPDEVGLVVDGNPDTGWRTQTYQRTSKLGGLKSGVGLLLDFGTARAISSLQVQLAGTPTSLEVWADPGADLQPTTLEGMRKVSSIRAVQSTATLRFASPVTSRFFVVWLTDLPTVSGGFRGEIREITASGASQQ